MRVSAILCPPVAVLTLDGSMTVTQDFHAFRHELGRALELNAKRLVLDMDGIGYMDCHGIGVLVDAYCAAQKKGCELKLINVNERPSELLELFGLTRLLQVSRDKAVNVRKRASSQLTRFKKQKGSNSATFGDPETSPPAKDISGANGHRRGSLFGKHGIVSLYGVRVEEVDSISRGY